MVFRGGVLLARYNQINKRRKFAFSKSKLTLQIIDGDLINNVVIAREYPVTLMAAEAEISENTACAIYQWLREVCSTALLGMPMILGGPGVIVQIDESQFKHKPNTHISEAGGHPQ